EEIHTHVRNLQQATASIGRIQALRTIGASAGEATDKHARATLPAGSLAVRVDHVSFHYSRAMQVERLTSGPVDKDPESEQREPGPAPEQVLHDLTFELAADKVLGLLGRTGSGKTTLTRLLLRFYEPAHGAIRLGGLDIRQTSLEDLRRRVGMVTQEVQI